MSTLIQDLRYGARMLIKNPGFTLIAIITLSLGIGATTAIFSVVDAVYLRAWPAPNPEQLAVIRTQTPQGMWPMVAYADYQDLNRQTISFAGILAYSRQSRFLHLGVEAEMILVDVVSPNYFSVLGLNAAAGQMFAAESSTPVAVISHDLWRRRFGGDPNLIGKQIRLNDKFVTVMGVAPAGFHGLQRFVPTNIWLPVSDWAQGDELTSRDNRNYELVGRLKPATGIEQARAELASLSANLAAAYPATNRDRKFIATSEAERVRGELPSAAFLLAVVGLVLVVACANVAGLLLARAETRRKDIAIRQALGASRRRLLRQSLTESLLLALAGAALGLLLTSWLLDLQPAILPPSPVPLGFDLRVDGRTLSFAVMVTALTVSLFGLWPALRAAKVDLVSSLKNDGANSLRERITARNVIVVGQIALSALLLTVAGLLLRSFLFSQSIHPGFEAGRNLLAVKIAPSIEGADRIRNFYSLLAERVRALPGVKEASYARRILLSGSGGGASKRVALPGVDLPIEERTPMIKFNAVAANYFATVGTRILQGRGFDERDAAAAPKVAVITQTMAQRYWPKGDALDQRLLVEGAEYRIIGIAEDAKVIDIHEPIAPYIYFAFAQASVAEAAILVETAGDPAALVEVVRQQIREADANALFLDITTSRQLMRNALWDDRTAAWLVGGLSALGLFLAAIGLYALVAWMVSRRTREIGVRMALGAERSAVMMMILRQGLRLALIGVPIGLLIAFGVTRWLAGMLYGVRPADPLTFAAAALLGLFVAAIASYFPARRATKVDPMIALRCE
jgi:putative ABC transport system permease protein